MPFDPDKYLESKEVGFNPDTYLKKKGQEEPLEVGSEDGGLSQTTVQPLPSLPKGEGFVMPTKPEAAEDGFRTIQEYKLKPIVDANRLISKQAPKEDGTDGIYDLALTDTEKWYGAAPSPRKKIASFNEEAGVIKSKYDQLIDSLGDPNNIDRTYDKEISDINKKYGIKFENGELKFPDIEAKTDDEYNKQVPAYNEKIKQYHKEVDNINTRYQKNIADYNASIKRVGNYDKEIQDLANRLGLTFENGEVKVSQGEIDKYQEVYSRKLNERLSRLSDAKKNPYIKDVVNKLSAGSAGVLNTPYNVMALSEKAGNALLGLAGAEPSTYWQDFASYLNSNKEELSANSQRYEDDIITLVQNGDMGAAIGKAGLDIAESLPMLSTLIMGNAAGATKATLGFMGGSKSAEEYMSLNNRDDIGEFYKIVDAIGVGLSEILFEETGTIKILNGIKKGIQEKGQNIVRDELGKMLQTNMQRNVSLLMQGNSDMIREGVSEAMTQLTDNLIKKATVDPNLDIWDGVTDSAIVGGLIGKGINLSLNAANHVQTKGTRKAVTEAIKQVPQNYSLEAKEKIATLTLEKQAIQDKTKDAAKPIQEIVAPQVKAIDEEIKKIAAKEEGIELPKEEKPKEGEKKEPEATIPKSEVKVSPEGITSLKEEKPIEKPKEEGVVIGPKKEATPSMKRILSTGEENVFTRPIEKDGTEFGEITIEEKPEGWQVKRVDINEEKKGYGKKVYRELNDEAQKEGKVIISDLPDKISGKAKYMWESLVNSGEAIKNEDGSYKMLPPKEVIDFVNRIRAGEKMNSPEDLQFYENNKKSIESQLKTTEEPSNAKRVSETTGQVQEGGNVRPEGEGNGSQNIQQPEEAGAKASDEGTRLTQKKAVPIEDSPLTKKPDKSASIKEEKLLKEQKKKLMDDLYSVEDILAGENIDNVRKTRELVTKEKASLSVESEYEYNANNITPEIKKKLEKVGVKVKDGMFHIDIYKDGTAIVGSIDDAIGMVEKNFPMRMPSVKTGITGPRTKKFDARSEALDYKDFKEAEQRYNMAVENDKQAREKGTEGMKKFWGEKLVQEQQIFNEAKKIDYDELNKQRRYSNDKEYQEFFNENEDALEFEGVNRRDLYELLNEKGRPEKLSMEEVIPMIIKDKIDKSGASIKTYENQLLQQITSTDLKLLDAFGRKDGKGLRQPKNNREESSLRVLKHLRDKAQHEYDDFKKYKKQLSGTKKEPVPQEKEAPQQPEIEEEKLKEKAVKKERPKTWMDYVSYSDRNRISPKMQQMSLDELTKLKQDTERKRSLPGTHDSKRSLTEKIWDIDKLIKAHNEANKFNEEQKIKEAAGQQEFEETAFAKQKKGAKKPPLSKDKTIKVSEPIKGEKETIPPPEGPWIDEEKMSNEGLKGMEPPEIVELYKKLSGKFPGLKNFTDKLGVFYHKEGGEFKIMLNRSLFKGKDVEMLGKVIAHEVGHFIDSLPGITLKRGDILGRIASLKDYFSKLLAEKPGKEDTVLTDKDRVELRSEAKRSLKEEYDKGIREIIEEVIEETPVFDEVGLTAEDIRQIWIDNEARENNPELYEYIAKLSGYQKAKIMKDAIKGLVDSEIVKRFNKGKIIGTKITKKQIKKIITPAPVTPQAIAEKYRELLKKEINKRRLFEAEIITEELKALTKWWNPFDVNQDATYTKYRHSSVELYAEAVSVLFNNPQALAERAPFFNRAFFNYFGNKPTVKDVYNEIQGLLNKPKEDLFRDRLRRMFDGFKRSMKKRSEIANKKRESKLSWLDTVQKDLFSLIIPMIKPIPEGKHLTTALNDRQFLRNALEKMAFANERVAKMLVEMNNNVTTELEKSGISFEDFSAILAFDRQLSQRTTIANPYAFQQKASSELKSFIEANMSEKQVADMKRILDTFHKSVFDITEEAYKAGVYSKDMFDVIEKNKDSYVTYAVVDYIDKNSIPVSFKKATGTLKEIESPYISTLFKLASMIKATERQNAVNALIETYNKYLPGEITEAKSVKIKGVTIAEKVEQGKQTVHYWKNGKWTAIAVDPYIAEFFDLNRMAELNSVARAFRAYNKVFKPIVTTWNVGWAFFSNILRDHPRSFYNLFAILGSTENISKADLAVLPFTYLNTVRKILPQAKKFVDGDLTPLVDTMIDEGVLKHGFFGSYDPYADEPVGPIFQKFGLIQKDKSMRDKMAERSKILKYAIKILSGIEYLGQILEVSSKMTAFTILENKLKDAKSAGFYTRNYAGTPNYLDKGTLTHTTNEIFTFSNVILQALRTDSEIAFKPQTRGAYWTAQAISVVTPAALMALAAAGLFGDELEDLYAQLTEYEKTNYLCIVWGKTKDGKPIYSKIPIPEFSRISHAITYKIISNTTEKDGLEWRDATDILSVGAAMTPSPSPLIKTAIGWGQYLAQKNPYDAFYGETILTDREQAMRGWPALSKMATWSLKNMGGTFIVKMYDYDPLKNTTTEYALQNIPLVSRMIKIGGRGQSETLSKVGEMERRKRAKESYERDKVINDYVLKSVSLGLDYNKSGDVLDELKAALYGDTNLTSEQKAEFAAAKKKFKAKLLKGLHTPFSNAVGAIIDSKSNDEKVVKLQQYGLIYGEDKLGELLRYMNEQDLISKPLRSKILQTVDGMDLDEEKRNLIIQSLNESGYYLDTFENNGVPEGLPID